MPFRGNHVRAVLGITIAVPAVANGAVMDWAHQFGGSYHDNTNWIGGVVPAAPDVARFDDPAAASALILFPNYDVYGTQLVVNDGTWVFNLTGDDYELTSQSSVSGQESINLAQGAHWATLYVQNGTMIGHDARTSFTAASVAQIAGSLYVAGNESAGDAFGRVNVFDNGQLTVANDIVLWREAIMEVETGATAAANHLHVRGGYAEADGAHLVISDELTTSAVNGILVNGTNSASATVDANGAVSTPDRTEITTQANGFGEVLVTENSSWTSTNGVDIGDASAAFGRMEIADGSTLSSNDDVNVYANGELVLNGGTIAAPFVDVFGTLRGSGDMDSYVTAYNGAQVRPGLSPGLMTVTSNSAGFSPRAGSTIEIELGGAANADFDRIHVAGPVEILGGTIVVKAINGYVPAVGQTFEIITSTVPAFPGGVYGTFDGVEPAANYALVYTQQAVLLKVIETPCPADFDGSTKVGFADLTAMLNAYGACGAPCPYDLDGSGHVGFGDLTLLLTAWGPC